MYIIKRVIIKLFIIKNEDTLILVELSVLNKLKQYQEKTNRDRFILYYYLKKL